jgi:hypothetical protein
MLLVVSARTSPAIARLALHHEDFLLHHQDFSLSMVAPKPSRSHASTPHDGSRPSFTACGLSVAEGPCPASRDKVLCPCDIEYYVPASRDKVLAIPSRGPAACVWTESVQAHFSMRFVPLPPCHNSSHGWYRRQCQKTGRAARLR